MKMEVVFKDGKKLFFDHVESFNVRREDDRETVLEGNYLEVNPCEINRDHFKMARNDENQEKARQMILEAFVECDKYPKKYLTPFYTMVPKKKWKGYKTVRELHNMYWRNGLHVANWIELALEWAQRISNGENWENICNNEDTQNCYRLIVWKNGFWRVVGGSRTEIYCNSSSYIYDYDCNYNFRLLNTVPLLIAKKISIDS